MFKLLKKTNLIERIFILISVVLIYFQVWLELKVPGYMSEITTKLQEPNTVMGDILKPGSTMVLLSLASFGLAIIVGFFSARIAAGLTYRIRGDIYNQVMSYSPTEMSNFSIPSLLTRTTNDVKQIQDVIAMGMLVMIKAPIMVVMAIFKIANKNWEWTAATAIAVFVLIIMLITLVIFVKPKFNIIQNLTDKINRITQENLSGIRVVRAYNAEKYQNNKFNETNKDLSNVNLFTNRMMAIISPVMTLISSGLTLSVYWIGAHIIEAAQGMDKINLFSDMVVFTSYAMQVIFGFIMLTMIFIILPRAMVSANRINEVLETKSSILYNSNSGTLSDSKGEVEFSNVTFRYPDAAEPVIKNINFKTEKGQTVAFIGSTGSGKSTLINLLPRFYDVTDGAINIDGKNIKDYSQEDLNNKVGYIPQKAVLFSGTIRSNIDFGESKNSPLDDKKIEDALDIAQAASFVNDEKQKLDTHVAQGGTNFSGGQKQRLAIARVVARKPEILIFDDSFSALDYKTDKKLRDILNKELADTTKLIVAQRISTIMDADQIIILDKGQMVGKGTHKELLENNQVYQEIAYSQLSKEELLNA